LPPATVTMPSIVVFCADAESPVISMQHISSRSFFIKSLFSLVFRLIFYFGVAAIFSPVGFLYANLAKALLSINIGNL